MNPAFELNGTPQFLPSYSVVSTVDWMNWSPFCEMESEMSSSQLCAAYSAVQITSMPSTSHSEDLACRRWIWRRRCSPASSGSSSSLTFAFGFALLKLSTTVPKAPLVSFPMHHVTLPEALAWVAFSASGAAASSSSPPPPHPAIASINAAASAAMSRGIVNIEIPPRTGKFKWALPACGGGYSIVHALADLLRELGAEGGEVVGLAARHEAVLHHDLLVDPLPARVRDVGLDAGPGRELAAPDHVRLHERPWAVTDRRDRLVRVEERAHEAHRLVVRAEEVRVRHTAREHKAVVIALVRLLDRLVDTERVALVQVLEALYLAALERDQLGRAALLLDLLPGLGQLDLLDTVRCQKGHSLAVKFSHAWVVPGYRSSS